MGYLLYNPLNKYQHIVHTNPNSINKLRRLNQLIGLFFLFLIIVAIITTMMLIRRSNSDDNYNYNHSGGIYNTTDMVTNDTSIMYLGNWSARDYTQLTQHTIMISIIMDNNLCRNEFNENDPNYVPHLYYTIQCGSNQTMSLINHDDNNQKPTAAIEFESSSQKGNCIRTSVNILTCTASVILNYNNEYDNETTNFAKSLLYRTRSKERMNTI